MASGTSLLSIRMKCPEVSADLRGKRADRTHGASIYGGEWRTWNRRLCVCVCIAYLVL